MTDARKATLHTDGGSRGNPGPAGIGIHLELSTGEVYSAGAFIGEATNNEAEYKAIIWGLENALSARVASLRIIADSELIIKQLRGEYKVKKKELQVLCADASKLLARFAEVSLENVPIISRRRRKGRANEAMDAKRSIGDFVVDYGSFSGGVQMSLALESVPALKPEAAREEESDSAGEKERTTMSGIYTLTVKDHFDAAHNLYGYPGECRNLHGHTWDVEVSVASPHLDGIGIVYDFKNLKDDLKSILATYDHTYINEHEPFDKMSPTAENLARVICLRLQDMITADVVVKEVAVWESPIARVGYSPAD